MKRILLALILFIMASLGGVLAGSPLGHNSTILPNEGDKIDILVVNENGATGFDENSVKLTDTGVILLIVNVSSDHKNLIAFQTEIQCDLRQFRYLSATGIQLDDKSIVTDNSMKDKWEYIPAHSMINYLAEHLCKQPTNDTIL